jgi:hemolysin activation/secretion protein
MTFNAVWCVSSAIICRKKDVRMGGIIAGSVVAALLLAGAVPSAWSQANLPAGDHPGRIEKRFEPPRQPLSVIEPILPQSRLPQEEADHIRFVLSGVSFDGPLGSVREADLLPLYAGSLGKEISLTGLYAVADAITARLQPQTKAIIPAQKIQSGVVHLSIVPGGAR